MLLFACLNLNGKVKCKSQKKKDILFHDVLAVWRGGISHPVGSETTQAGSLGLGGL